jgi:peroxiredoxin
MLRDTLLAFRDGLEDRVGAAMAADIRQADERLRASGIAEQALKEGDTAPDFTLPDADGKQVRLYEQLATGPVVLVFYRGGWCPFCSLSLRAYDQIAGAVRKHGGSILGVGLESPEQARDTAETHRISFPLLWDHGLHTAEQFGLGYDLDASMRAMYQLCSHDVPALSGTGAWRLPMAATFVIARNGRIVRAMVDSSVYRRMEPDDALEAVAQMSATVPRDFAENASIPGV